MGRLLCRACRLDYLRAYNAARAERRHAAARARYAANPEPQKQATRLYRRNLARVCACGRPVQRTGTRTSLWCSEACRQACQWSACESLAAGLALMRKQKGLTK